MGSRIVSDILFHPDLKRHVLGFCLVILVSFSRYLHLHGVGLAFREPLLHCDFTVRSDRNPAVTADLLEFQLALRLADLESTGSADRHNAVFIL